MNELFILILTLLAGSAVSLGVASLLFLTKRRRSGAIAVALPFGAGALLAAAFFDLLPEALEAGNDSHELLHWMVLGFIIFFVLERTASWFHHHHQHDTEDSSARSNQQNRLMIIGDLVHNVIDGAAVGAAFLVSVPTGVIAAIAVSAHEIPKEIGTFGILMSRGWKDKKVIGMNLLTAAGTIISATAIYLIGQNTELSFAPLLALTAGFFLYVAASDIIPDIHEQPRRRGMMQAGILVATIIVLGYVIEALHS